LSSADNSITLSISLSDNSGLYDLSNAAIPDTIGALKEVPFITQ
jgi:hypothetical protein